MEYKIFFYITEEITWIQDFLSVQMLDINSSTKITQLSILSALSTAFLFSLQEFLEIFYLHLVFLVSFLHILFSIFTLFNVYITILKYTLEFSWFREHWYIWDSRRKLCLSEWVFIGWRPLIILVYCTSSKRLIQCSYCKINHSMQ